MVETRATAKKIKTEEKLPETTVVPLPTKKLRQNGVITKKQRRGKPGELCQLNLDVLFLLAAYIHPLDLLNLARTCKSLRELLMDKSSAFVWKTARRQVNGLPDCPADLTEPEYANLVCYPRCHGCGKYATKILWNIRRRYCPNCRATRLCPLSSCPDFVRYNCILPMICVKVNKGREMWVDKEQLDLITREYGTTTDKAKFLKEERIRYDSIRSHASLCTYWENNVASERKHDLKLRRLQRYEDIFERLKQHGYERNIEHFGPYEIQQLHKSFFKRSKPLTDKEWELMLPKWAESMKDFTSQRMNTTVYRPRRELLLSAYDSYTASRSSNTPAFEFLPHVTEVTRFAPFREVIYAPEETEIGPNPFESAFEQLPELVNEWKKQLDAKFSELVQIPSHLSLQATSDDPDMASSSATRTELIQIPSEKLRLACAIFERNLALDQYGCYSEILSSVIPHFPPDPVCEGQTSELQVSVKEQYDIRFVVEAAYIVRACGLDPNVATVEDMDRRNARLKCLACPRSYVMTWRTAVRHWVRSHPAPDLKLSDWELVSNEYMDAIQAAELSSKKDSAFSKAHCLLCYPRVGGAMHRLDMTHHIYIRHDLELDAIQQGVHYKPVHELEPPLEMVNEEGIVTFVAPSTLIRW